jgi:hypothetical protein
MIHITKDGFKRFEWDGDLQQDVEQEFDSILCLREGVTQIEEGVTLGEIITFTYQDEFLRGFIGCYSTCNVGAFYEELQRGVKPIAADEEVQHCTVAMRVEISEPNKHKPAKVLDISLDFHGRGANDQHWGLDLSPLAEIAALPFRLEANAAIQRYVCAPATWRRWRRLLGLPERTLEVEDGLRYTPSLLEVLDGIFFDISFHGSPAARDARRLEVEKAAQEIRDGTAKLAPLKLD